MNFDNEILRVLTLAGSKGLKTEKVARHVFNACNSMFTPLNYKDVHAYISQFLIKCSKDALSVIEKGEGHGIYRINFSNQKAQQLLLKFSPHHSNKRRQLLISAAFLIPVEENAPLQSLERIKGLAD